MLDRLAFGGRVKKKDVNGSGAGPEEEEDSRPPTLPRDEHSSSPSRFNPTLPSIPNLGAFRKLSIQANTTGAGKYGSLGDTEDYNTAPPSPTRSSPHPPTFRRSQTAPMAASSSHGGTPSPTSPGFRRVPPLPTLPPRGPVGRVYRAQWAYSPATGSSHGHGGGGGSAEDEAEPEDLPLDRGDLVRIEEEITADWWRGVVVSGPAQGRRGMLPSAYVVPHDADASARSVVSSGAGGTNLQGGGWRTEDGHSSAPETSSDGHGLDTDTDGGEDLLSEDGAPRWSIGNGSEHDEDSPFGDELSRAHAAGRMSHR